jgi:hypothetical protein
MQNQAQLFYETALLQQNTINVGLPDRPEAEDMPHDAAFDLWRIRNRSSRF